MKSRTLILGVLFVPLSVARAADEPLKPITIEVVDAKTKKPVTGFEYDYWITFVSQAPRGFKDSGEGKVSSPAGSFEIQAPVSCELTLHLESRDSLRGYGHNFFSYVIKSDDPTRKVRAELEFGMSVRGVVRDAETKRPVAGAKVSPVIHRVPGYDGDDDRTVLTNKEGKYELHGVDPKLGVVAEHRDYPEEDELLEPREKPIEPVFDIELRKPEKPKFLGNLRGLVQDVDGKPIADVEVSAEEHETHTAADGTFEVPLETTKNARCYIAFRKTGCIQQSLMQGLPLPPRLTITLEPEPRIEGHVRNAAGQPIDSFTIMAGLGENPRDFECVKEKVRDRTGRFSLTLEEPGRTWVGIRGDGLAHWEGHVTLGRKKEVLDVTLSPGSTVTGRVAVPRGIARELHATLVPRRSGEDGPHHHDLAVQKLATLEDEITADGRFRFSHVRPGHYVLRVHGPGATARRILFQVLEAATDVGTLAIAGTGRIEGTVHHPPKEGGGIWPFAHGMVFSPALDDDEEPQFTADESGHFVVGGVPVGLVSVGFPVQHYDVITYASSSAQVFERQTTEVNAFDPREDRRLTVALRIGDGSEQQFASGSSIGAAREVSNVNVPSTLFAGLGLRAGSRPAERHRPKFMLDLSPHLDARVSFEEPHWSLLDEQGRIALLGVTSGHYHARLLAFPGWIRLGGEPLFETDLEMKPGATPLKVVLGAGSITGQFEDLRHAEVFAVGKRTGRSFRTWTAWGGNFCSRFLPDDTYTLLIHSAEKGWARVPDIAVRDETRDIGVIKAILGGTVRGRIIARVPSEVPDAVVAIGPDGIELKVAGFQGDHHGEYALSHLWPGDWAVVLRSGPKKLAERRIRIEQNETLTVDLVIAPPATP